MEEALHVFAGTLLQSVESFYNVAWAVPLTLFLTKLDGRPRLPLVLARRYVAALVVVWILGTVSDLVFPNSIAWTVAPALVCAAFFRDWRAPVRLVRTALLMCSWMYALAAAEVVNASLSGGAPLAAAVSLAYMLVVLAIVELLERRIGLDERRTTFGFVIPLLVVCASGLVGRAILYLRSDFGLEPYSVSALESVLTCLSGQIAELVVWGSTLRLVRELGTKEQLMGERHLMESRYDALRTYRESGERLRMLRHEVKNQYAYIRMLLEQKDYERAEEFFGEMSMRANPTFSWVSSGNDLVDDIVNLEVSKARSAGVEVSARIAVPSELPYEEIDLCSLFTNLLDNAIEACAALPADSKDEKVVRLSAVADQGTLLVTVSNPAPAAPRIDERGLPRTTKAERERHGYGTAILQGIAEKYHGVADFSYEDGTFVARVMLALTEGEGNPC